jgi:hypothetical protein
VFVVAFVNRGFTVPRKERTDTCSQVEKRTVMNTLSALVCFTLLGGALLAQSCPGEPSTNPPVRICDGRSIFLDTQQIIADLEAERDRLDKAIAALQGCGRRKSKRRTMLAEARRKISIAQKKRWAAQKRAAKVA